MKKTLILCLLVFCFAFAKEQKSVAVLHCKGDYNEKSLLDLKDKVQEAVRKTLPVDDYKIMTDDDMVTALSKKQEGNEDDRREAAYKAMNRAACSENGVCEGELLSDAEMDYGAWCEVRKVEGNKLELKFYLYKVIEGNLIHQEGYDSYNPKNYDDLVKIIKKEVPNAVREKILGIKKKTADPYDTSDIDNKPVKKSTYVAIGLNVLGAAMIGYGIYENGQAKTAFDKYSERGQTSEYYEKTWKDAESSRDKRNMFFIIGGAVLASGIGVHIWF